MIKVHRTLPEVFTLMQKHTTVKDKAAVLNEYDSKELRFFLFYVFNENAPKITKLKIPDYKPLKNVGFGDGHVTLGHSIRRLEMLRELCGISEDKLNKILYAMLTSVHPEEAKLIEMLVTHNFKIPKLSYTVVSEAFPELVPIKTKNKKSKKK